MKARTRWWWIWPTLGLVAATLIVVRPFGGSMVVVFASLTVVVAAIIRDAFVADPPDRPRAS